MDTGTLVAKALRGFLTAKNVALSHSDCLEIVARQFGFADWNTLAAKLDVTPQRLIHSEDCDDAWMPVPPNANRQPFQTHTPEELSCSFCAKPQNEVRSLVEGRCSSRGTRPCIFICDECVALCAQVNADAVGDTPQDRLT